MRLGYTAIILISLLFPSNVTLAIRADGYDYELGISRNDIAEDHENKGPFYVKPVEYSVVCEYDFEINKGDNKLSMGNLVWLAQQAWLEMSALHKEWFDQCDAAGGNGKGHIRKSMPGMMAAVSYGKRIVFASSIKQNNPNKIMKHSRESLFTRSMARCRQEWIALEGVRFPHLEGAAYHRNEANCAEIMAFAIIYKETGKLPKDLGLELEEELRSAAWGAPGERNNRFELPGRLTDPCSGFLEEPDDPRRIDVWGRTGCNEILKNQNVQFATVGITAEETDKRPINCKNVSLRDAFTFQEVS